MEFKQGFVTEIPEFVKDIKGIVQSNNSLECFNSATP